MASQPLRRASSGCDETGAEAATWAEGPRPARRVSWMPGAEGAEWETMWEWVLAWEFSGTMRRDCIFWESYVSLNLLVARKLWRRLSMLEGEKGFVYHLGGGGCSGAGYVCFLLCS